MQCKRAGEEWALDLKRKLSSVGPGEEVREWTGKKSRENRWKMRRMQLCLQRTEHRTEAEGGG